MPTSPRLQLPYPDQGTNPFFDAFVNFVNALDAELYTHREDKNILIMGGGTVTWNSTTGVLSWSSAIELTSTVTGVLWTIAAGSVTLSADGQLAYVTLPRGPTASTAVTMTVGTTTPSVPNGASNLLVCYRYGGSVYFRNGFVISNGQSLSLFGPISTSATYALPIFAGDTTTTTTWVTIASVMFKPGDYSAGYKLYLRAILQTALGTDTCQLQLTDPNNVLGGGAGATVTGSVLSTSSTSLVEVEAEIAALEGLASNIILDAQLQSAGGNTATCLNAAIYVVVG